MEQVVIDKEEEEPLHPELDEIKPLDSPEEHPLLKNDLGGHEWKNQHNKYIKGWRNYFEFEGNGDRKQAKKKIKKIHLNLIGRITGERPLSLERYDSQTFRDD